MFNALFLRQFADEQRVIVFCHDIAVEALNHYLLLLQGVNDTVVALNQIDVIANAHITIEILLTLFVQRAPCAKVAPAEVGRTNEYLFGFLHDSIVH